MTCAHTVTKRDICNRGTCLECGADMGIGYAEGEFPSDNTYLGISRKSRQSGMTRTTAALIKRQSLVRHVPAEDSPEDGA